MKRQLGVPFRRNKGLDRSFCVRRCTGLNILRVQRHVILRVTSKAVLRHLPVLLAIHTELATAKIVCVDNLLAFGYKPCFLCFWIQSFDGEKHEYITRSIKAFQALHAFNKTCNET